MRHIFVEERHNSKKDEGMMNVQEVIFPYDELM